MAEEVTHKKIYDRLCAIGAKVDKIYMDTEGIVKAFSAAQGAFTVLEWLAKAAKPILWIGGFFIAIGAAWEHVKFK